MNFVIVTDLNTVGFGGTTATLVEKFTILQAGEGVLIGDAVVILFVVQVEE